MNIGSSAVQAFDWPSARRRLAAWYRRNRRDLPWRRRQHDPYAQLVAELMLHQTQVATVVPYFKRFMRRFPDVRALARADRSEVIALWAGLGYYRRGHFLHEAARMIVNDMAGKFPRTTDALMQLPGVGRYTAGAIASISFDERAPVLDGNVKRVLLRLMAIHDAPETPAVAERLWSIADDALPRRNCGEFNQALMELGATLCTPRQPKCDACPLRSACNAHLQNLVDAIPRPRVRRKPRPMTMIALVAIAGSRVLVRRRGTDALWPGAWEIPSAEPTDPRWLNELQKLAPAPVWRSLRNIHDAGKVSHQLTHRSVVFHVYAATARAVRLPAGYAWAKLGGELPLPTAFRKVLDAALLNCDGQPAPAGRRGS